jgi:hypothetical protein
MAPKEDNIFQLKIIFSNKKFYGREKKYSFGRVTANTHIFSLLFFFFFALCNKMFKLENA